MKMSSVLALLRKLHNLLYGNLPVKRLSKDLHQVKLSGTILAKINFSTLRGIDAMIILHSKSSMILLNNKFFQL